MLLAHSSSAMASINIDNLNALSDTHPKPNVTFVYGTAGMRTK